MSIIVILSLIILRDLIFNRLIFRGNRNFVFTLLNASRLILSFRVNILISIFDSILLLFFSNAIYSLFRLGLFNCIIFWLIWLICLIYYYLLIWSWNDSRWLSTSWCSWIIWLSILILLRWLYLLLFWFLWFMLLGFVFLMFVLWLFVFLSFVTNWSIYNSRIFFNLLPFYRNLLFFMNILLPNWPNIFSFYHILLSFRLLFIIYRSFLLFPLLWSLLMINISFWLFFLFTSLWIINVDFWLDSFYLYLMRLYRPDDISIISLLFWFLETYFLWFLSWIYPIVRIGWHLLFLLDLIYIFSIVIWSFWLLNDTSTTYYMTYIIFVHYWFITFWTRFCSRLASFKMSLKTCNWNIQLTILTKFCL